MEPNRLEEHLRALATLEETEAPVISCYLDLSDGLSGCRDALEQRAQLLRKCTAASASLALEEAIGKIEKVLQQDLPPRAKGLAIFSRGGESPFLLALDFEVPMPTWIAAGSTPNIYHLVELKDNYDRYLILLATETSARIIGVNLGSVTAQLWRARPELRRRVGREWTKDHYQNHCRERTRQFVHDLARVLNRISSEGGYRHLILAGSARLTSAVRKALPKRLARNLVDFVPACGSDNVSDIVASTLETFLALEEMESQAIAEKLLTQIRTHGLGVAGPRAAMEVLKAGQADILVMVKDYDPGQAWQCVACGITEFTMPRPNTCPKCGTSRLREFDVRGELARLAEQRGVVVEVVEHSDALANLGGVGCLLRYSGPANYLYSAA